MRVITYRGYICLCIVGCLLLYSCATKKEYYQYYSQKEVYVKATGTLISITYNDDCSALYLAFSDLKPMFDDDTFKIVGDNLQVVKDNHIDSKLQVGDQISFVSAPKYFGDGYVFPIVSLSVNGEILLSFEDGFSNYLKWIDNE